MPHGTLALLALVVLLPALVEPAWLRVRGRVPLGGPLAGLAVAQVVSGLLVFFLGGTWVSGHLAPLLAAELRVALPFALVVLALAAALVEWPWYRRLLGTWRRGLAWSLAGNLATTALLALSVAPACRLSLLRARGEVLAVPGTVWFLRDGGLWRRDGTDVQRILEQVQGTPGARLAARRGLGGWDLWLVARDAPPRRLLEGFAAAESGVPQPPESPWPLGKGWRSGPLDATEVHGPVPEALGGPPSSVRVRLGPWSRQGVEVTRLDGSAPWSIALHTPLVSRPPRAGIRLPGDRLLFQAGPELLVLDLAGGELISLGRGQSPLVVLPVPAPAKPAPPGSSPAAPGP